jgi:hypothetical protein
METKQICIFCGGTTMEQHPTGIGFIFIHPDCLEDLEEILSITKETEGQMPM